MFGAVEIVCVGKYREKNLENLELHYSKQLKKLHVTELKSFAEDVTREQKEIETYLTKFTSSQVFLLTEKGKTFKDSLEFSNFLMTQNEKTSKSIVFVISGAIGFSEEMKAKYNTLSLSPLTMPHKLCRLVLVEQIYRAHTILTGHPYHN